MAGLFSGAIAGPLLVGVLAEHEQFAIAWSACAACALLAACLVLAVRELATPRRSLRAGTVRSVFNTLLHHATDAR